MASRTKRSRHLFIMDPLERLSFAGDTTLDLMRAARAKGIATDMVQVNHLAIHHGEPVARVTPCHVTGSIGAPKVRTEPITHATAGDYDVVWMRKDPPVTQDYLFGLYWTELAPPHVQVFNDPKAIGANNEKLLATRFAHHMPATVMTADLTVLMAFLKELGGRMVVKPVDGYAGKGVLLAEASNPTCKSLLETMTDRGARPIVAQEYLPEIKKGDIRVLLWRGRYLGAVRRFPPKGDIRSNLAVGGRAAKAGLAAPLNALVKEVGPALAGQGFAFVGLDVIGGKLTEVNITSPTGIVPASRFAGRDLALDIMADLLKV